MSSENYSSRETLPWFLSRADAKQIYAKPEARYLVLDFENTTLEKGSALNPDNEIILACWKIVSDGKELCRKHWWGSEFEMGELLEDIRSVDFVVAQNAKHELQWLKRCGLDLREVLVYDTLLAQWVLDGNQRRPRNLSALCRMWGAEGKLDIVAGLIAAGVSTTDIPTHWLLEYCYQDIDSTDEVFRKQVKAVYERDQQHLVFQRNLTCAVLADIEFNGMELDKERVFEEYDRVSTRLAEIQERLDEIADGRNLASAKQRAELLYDVLGFKEAKDYKGKTKVTKAGARATDRATISQLVCKTEEQREFIDLYKEYNNLSSLLVKNLMFFRLVCEQQEGKFWAIFNQNIAQTHRLTSSGRPVLFAGEKKPRRVQFQNLPRPYKRFFTTTKKDYLLGESDGSQLEFRVAADICSDLLAIEEIENNVDVHANTRDILKSRGVILHEDDDMARTLAKPLTFKPLYGGSKGSPEIEVYSAEFKLKYKSIAEEQQSWAIHVLNEKELRTRYGMIFYWPDTTMSRSGYISNTTNIYNYPIQGLATAEIIPIAMIYFWHRTKDTTITLLNTIHDSLVSEFHKDEAELYITLSRVSMTSDVFWFLENVYGYTFKTPLGVGTKIATHWGDTKTEMKYTLFPNGKEEVR